MKPPTYIKVGANTFRLYMTKKAWRTRLSKDGEAHTTRGHTSIHHQKIWCDPSGAQALVRETVVHELLHALLDDSGAPITEDEEHEEMWIRALSPRLYACLVENPELVAYLTEDVSPRASQEP